MQVLTMLLLYKQGISLEGEWNDLGKGSRVSEGCSREAFSVAYSLVTMASISC